MPNIDDLGSLIDPAQVMHYVSSLPGNIQYAMENAVSQAIANAAIGGLFTTTVNVSAYTNSLVQLLMKKLVDNGYNVPTLTTAGILTVSWN